jgi:hypothetical protein
VVAAAAAYHAGWASLAYAHSLHLSATFLGPRRADSLVLMSPSVHAAARALAVAGLAAGAAYAGPPLPVLDAPGLPSCCGALAHLAAWACAETVGTAVLAGLLDWGFFDSQ